MIKGAMEAAKAAKEQAPRATIPGQVCETSNRKRAEPYNNACKIPIDIVLLDPKS